MLNNKGYHLAATMHQILSRYYFFSSEQFFKAGIIIPNV